MNERLIKIEELKQLKEKYLKAQEEQKINNTQNVNTTNNNQGIGNQMQGPVLVKANPKAPSLLDKAGFSNIIYLAAMSLMFEVLFLAISFLIYK